MKRQRVLTKRARELIARETRVARLVERALTPITPLRGARSAKTPVDDLVFMRTYLVDTHGAARELLHLPKEERPALPANAARSGKCAAVVLTVKSVREQFVRLTPESIKAVLCKELAAKLIQKAHTRPLSNETHPTPWRA